MKLSKLINENKYTNQTGIKSSLLNNVEFLSLLTQPAKNWIIGRDVRIYKGDLGFVFTDGKREMVFNLKKPFSLIKRLGNARAEIKTIYQQNESVNEAKYNVGDTITVTLKGGKTVKGKVEKLNPLKVRTGPTSVQVLGNHLIQNILKESVNELKKLPSGNFSIKKGYNTFADYEKNAKPGDTILKYDKRGNMVKTFVSGNELHQNAKKYLSKVHSIVGDKVNLSLFGKQGYASVPDYEKKEVGVLVLESINEASYDLGNQEYTSRKLTSTQILDLAYAYANVPGKGNPMYNNKMEKMIKVANDLAKLTGAKQMNPKARGGEPALILFLLKNKLVTQDEYVKLYKNLSQKHISVAKALKNADPASRMIGGAAARQAHKDMRGEFDSE